MVSNSPFLLLFFGVQHGNLAIECYLILVPKAHDSFNRSAILQSDDAASKMFNNTSGGKDFHQAKQEGDNNNEQATLTRYTSTSRQWAGFKNPRIVRVSKAFGGKDRHSKVCTVKGLRDRRIRLSVPTAIQLYDLQDRLGLNQPSKVIDWLIDSTKDDIDQLPPLQMLPEDFNQFLPAAPTVMNPQDFASSQLSLSRFLSTPNSSFVKDVGNRTLLYTKQGIKFDNNEDHDQRKKGKEALVVNEVQENGDGGLNFFPIPQYSYPAGLYPYNPYYNWEHSSNLSMSHFGNIQGNLVSSQTDSSMAIPSTSQVFLCPSAAAATPCPSFLMPNFGENNHQDLIRQTNLFHSLSSSSQHVVPPNTLMPLFNPSDSQEKVPFGLDTQPKVRSHNNDVNR